jgi:predicted transcriptional regulator
MNEEMLKEIQQIKKLLVFLCIKDLDQKKQIQTLNSIGFQPKEIAELIGTTANTVSVYLNKIKKEGKVDRQKVKTSSSD